jgi:hypothetical protein
MNFSTKPVSMIVVAIRIGSPRSAGSDPAISLIGVLGGNWLVFDCPAGEAPHAIRVSANEKIQEEEVAPEQAKSPSRLAIALLTLALSDHVAAQWR